MNTKDGSSFEAVRPELTAYLCRLVLRSAVAEELAQTTFLRALEAADSLPSEPRGLRAWLFRVATNLAFDELRRHAGWKERLVFDLRELAESRPGFAAMSAAAIGTPETKAIAREHLAACFACALKNLPERKAAALLLKEVNGFTVDEAADILAASAAQVKNWLQEGRAAMNARYQDSCALVNKGGVCHQCVELDGFMRAGQGNPLQGAGDAIEGRLRVLKEMAARPWQPWHRHLFELLDDLK